MDLKSYVRSRGEKASQPADQPQTNRQDTDALKAQTEELSKKSEPELMEQLLSEVAKGKNDGTFSADALNSFAAQISPMLNEAQKKRLEALTSQLKSQL